MIVGLAALTFGVGLARGRGRGRHVHGRRRARRRRDPRRAAGRGDDHLGDRRTTDGAAARRDPAVAGRRDARQHLGDLLGQDRDHDREPDDGARGLDGRRHVHGQRDRLRPVGVVRDRAGRTPSPVDHRALHWTVLVGGACNDASIHEEDGDWKISGDPTEAALLVLAVKAGLSLTDLGLELPPLSVLPFSSERQYMATLHDGGPDRGSVLLVKGATERLVTMCSWQLRKDGGVEPIDAAAVLAAAEELAGEGLRVLATAAALQVGATSIDEGELPGTLVLTGLQGMLDPPRPSVADAVSSCHRAGIAVKMITGDHAVTAATIASRLGILPDDGVDGSDRSTRSDRVLTGVELDALSAADYPDVVERVSVFARMSPEQKLRLVAGPPGPRTHRRDDRRRCERRPGAAAGRHRRGDGQPRHRGGQGRRRHGAARRRLHHHRAGGRGGPRGLRQHHEVHRVDAADQHGRGVRHPDRGIRRRCPCRSFRCRSSGST